MKSVVKHGLCGFIPTLSSAVAPALAQTSVQNQVPKLLDSDGATYNNLSWSVAVSGETAVVGQDTCPTAN